jgi:hypothetical protein
MRDEFSNIKYYVSSAEYNLERANRQWAYYKNGHPITGETEPHYVASQKAYKKANEFAAKALELLNQFPNGELEKRAKNIIAICNRNK